MVILVELHDLIWRWKKLIEEKTSLQHSTNLGLMAKWPNSSFPVKILETMTGIYKNTPKKKRFSDLMNLIHVWGKPSTAYHLHNTILTVNHVAAASCLGGVFQRQGPEEVIREDGKLIATKYREILNENLVQSAQNLRLGCSPSNMTITLRHKPRPFRSGLVTNLTWVAQPRWDLEPITHKWLSTDGPQATWQGLRWSKEKNGKKLNKCRCAKPVCIIPKKTWGCKCCQSALPKFWV